MHITKLVINSINCPEFFCELDYSTLHNKPERDIAKRLIMEYANKAYPNIKCEKVNFYRDRCIAHIQVKVDPQTWNIYKKRISTMPDAKPTAIGYVRMLCSRWVDNGYMTELCDELMTLIMV